MTRQELLESWFQEEREAFSGWDFSRLKGRMLEETLPWDYRALVLERLTPRTRLLDMGTGGGEFLQGLGHPMERCAVTEGWAPNLALCREKLEPMGVSVRQVFPDDLIPYGDAGFDLVINRHESFRAEEVFRVLMPGGLFLTQQVGGLNGLDLIRKLIPDYMPAQPDHDLANTRRVIESAGFQVTHARECRTVTRFLEIGALVWYARRIPWEFPGVSVSTHAGQLFALQEELETRGFVSMTEERFVISAVKN